MEEKSNAVELAVEITTAWLSNPNTRVAPEDVHAFLKNSHATLVGMIDPPAEAAPTTQEAQEEFQGAVSVRKSLSDPEVIYSMIDGKPYKALRRHLATHGLTPEAYRERYGLKSDYPMVAPNYSKRRAEVARELGSDESVQRQRTPSRKRLRFPEACHCLRLRLLRRASRRPSEPRRRSKKRTSDQLRGSRFGSGAFAVDANSSALAVADSR